MATEYNIADISNRIRERITKLGSVIKKSVEFGRDFTCHVDEVNCLSDILETINNPDISDEDKDLTINYLMSKYNI